MPERWQHELEKLRTVGAPSSMRTRIDAGPVGNGVPPMPGRRQRVVAGVVAFAVFGGAIAFAWGAFGHRGSTIAATGPEGDVAVFTFLAHPTEGGADPTGTMVLGDVTVEAFGTSFCWDFGGGSMCADTIEPEFADADFGAVPAGTPIAIEGDAESVQGHVEAAGSYPFDRIGPLDTSDGSAALPTEAGRYIIEFDVTWSHGERSFYFPIRMVDASAPDPSILVATMTSPADGSMPGLVLAYDGRSQDFVAQGGAWPGVDGFDLPLLFFVSPIEQGAAIRVGGDASSVNGVLRMVADDGSLTEEEIPLDLSTGSARLPNEAGRFELVLKGTWDRGIAVFSVRIQIGQPTVQTPPALPDLVGMTDQNAMKTLDELGLTWVLAFRAVDGEQWRVVEMDPPAGSAITGGFEVRLVIATEITPIPEGAEDILACPAVDHVAFGGPHAVILPAGEAFIRGNTGGIEKTDDVTQISSDWSSELWQVVRDGAVVAVVDFDTLDGVACAGSGVGAA